jgi:hypothetical protein
MEFPGYSHAVPTGRNYCLLTQRGRAATKQEKGLGDIKMLWQDDGGKMISKL